MTMLHLVPQEISAYQNGHLRGRVLQPHRTMKVVLYVGLNLFQGPRRKGDHSYGHYALLSIKSMTKILFLICQSWDLSKACTEQQIFHRL